MRGPTRGRSNRGWNDLAAYVALGVALGIALGFLLGCVLRSPRTKTQEAARIERGR